MRASIVLAAVVLTGCAGTETLRSRPSTDDAPVAATESAPPTAEPVAPGRRHPADPVALALIRRADSLSYRPSDAGLRAVRCKAVWSMKPLNDEPDAIEVLCEWTSAGRYSVIPVRASADPGWFDDRALAECRELLLDLFDGPRLERQVEAFALAMREEDGKPFVLGTLGPGEARQGSDWIDLHFGDDGLLAQDGPGDRSVHPFCSRRRRFTYEVQGALFRRVAAKYFDDGHGLETYAYTTIDGILVPMRYASLDSGFLITLTIFGVEVNPPDLVGPAPSGPR